MLTFANLGCKLYCAMVPASRDRDNVTHWGWRHRATEDGWRSFRDDMHDAEPQFYSVSGSQCVYAKQNLQCPSACQYSPAWRQQLSATIELGPNQSD